MTILIDPLCRKAVPGWLVDQPAEQKLQIDPFAESLMETFRRGVAQEAREALALVRQFGLETPCAPPTS